MKFIAFVTATALMLACTPTFAAEFSVTEDTSPFPAPAIHPPLGADTILDAAVNCQGGGNTSIEIPTGADIAFISESAAESRVNVPLYLSAEQNAVVPKSIFVRFRYGEITAEGVISVGDQTSYTYPTPNCPSGVTVIFKDELLPTQSLPQTPVRPGLVPFPAEKN